MYRELFSLFVGNRNRACHLTKWREERGSGVGEYFTIARYIDSHKQTAQEIRKLPFLSVYIWPGGRVTSKGFMWVGYWLLYILLL